MTEPRGKPTAVEDGGDSGGGAAESGRSSADISALDLDMMDIPLLHDPEVRAPCRVKARRVRSSKQEHGFVALTLCVFSSKIGERYPCCISIGLVFCLLMNVFAVSWFISHSFSASGTHDNCFFCSCCSSVSPCEVANWETCLGCKIRGRSTCLCVTAVGSDISRTFDKVPARY